MQNGSLASDLGDWLGYNLATSYYQFEQWLANPANFQLALGILVITTAIAITGGAAIPAIMFGAAVGASLDLAGQAWGMVDDYRHGRPLRPLDWGSVGWSAFGGAVESAAFAVLGAVLTPVGFIARKGLGLGAKLGGKLISRVGQSLGRFGGSLVDDFSLGLGSLRNFGGSLIDDFGHGLGSLRNFGSSLFHNARRSLNSLRNFAYNSDNKLFHPLVTAGRALQTRVRSGLSKLGNFVDDLGKGSFSSGLKRLRGGLTDLRTGLLPGLKKEVRLNEFDSALSGFKGAARDFWSGLRYVYGSPSIARYASPSKVVTAALMGGGLNVFTNYLANEEYSLKRAGIDFAIGAAFGAGAYFIGEEFRSPFARVPALTLFNIVEGMSTALIHGDEYNANDLASAFIWGLTGGVGAEAITKYSPDYLQAKYKKAYHPWLERQHNRGVTEAIYRAGIKQSPSSTFNTLRRYQIGQLREQAMRDYAQNVVAPDNFRQTFFFLGATAVTDVEYWGTQFKIKPIPNPSVLISKRE